MHIEKNICDNVLGTLLDIPGKSKDHLNAHLDVQDMGIRKEPYPKQSEESRHPLLPKACFSMSLEEKGIFCDVIKFAKFTNGCASNITTSFQAYKFHDAHFILASICNLKHITKTSGINLNYIRCLLSRSSQ